MIKTPPLAGLQGLRGAAAALVVVDHALYTLVGRGGGDAALLAPADRLGAFGVELFFLISGVVMVLSATGRFGITAALAFVRRRLIRIVPLYWLATTVYLGRLVLSGHVPPAADIVRSYLFVPYLGPDGELQPIYGLGWTLNHELFFYAVFAVGLLRSWRATLFGTAAVLIGVVALGSTLAPPRPTGEGAALAQAVFFWSRPVVLFFVAGMGVGWALRARPRWLAPLRLPLGAALAVSGAVIGALLAWDVRQPLGLGVLLALLPLPVLLLSLARYDRPAAGGRQAAGVAFLIVLGDLSYSLYLTHPFVLGPAGRAYAWLGLPPQAMVPFIAACVLASTAVAWGVYRGVERPLMRALDRRLPDVATVPRPPPSTVPAAR